MWEGRPLADWRDAWGVAALHAWARVGSTMDIAREMAEDGAPAGTLVMAEEQTAGRGRGGRPWFSAPGWSLHLSMIMRPPGVDAPVLSALPLRLGLAVAAGIEEAAGVETRVKWPNDVVTVGHRKLAGVLCEAALGGGQPGFVIAGIGVNVGQDEEDFPPELRASATSVSREAGHLVRRPTVVGALLETVLPLATARASALTKGELTQLARRDALTGRALTLDGTPVGLGAGVEPDGALRIKDDTGEIRRIRAGTVRLLEAVP